MVIASTSKYYKPAFYMYSMMQLIAQSYHHSFCVVNLLKAWLWMNAFVFACFVHAAAFLTERHCVWCIFTTNQLYLHFIYFVQTLCMHNKNMPTHRRITKKEQQTKIPRHSGWHFMKTTIKAVHTAKSPSSPFLWHKDCVSFSTTAWLNSVWVTSSWSIQSDRSPQC